MTTHINPFAIPDPWNMVAKGYAETTMQFLSAYSQEALSKANLNPSARIIDVACGPGTLSMIAALQVAHVTSVDFSENMVSILNQLIKNKGYKNIHTCLCDGQELKFEDHQFDAAFSMFGLMFFPDRLQGFSELYRVLKPGGKALVSSWAPVDQSPVMQVMFSALRKMNPDMPDAKKAMDSLEQRDVFEDELRRANFKQIEVVLVRKSFAVPSIDAFWDSMVRGSAPIVMLKQKWGDKVFAEKQKLAVAYLHSAIPKVPTELTSDAWLGYGVK